MDHRLDAEQVHYEWNNALPPRLQIEPGDTVVLFTDGVTEAEDRNKNQFTDERLETLVQEIRHLDAGGMRDRICQAVLKFSEGIHAVDDTTVVVVQIAGATA